MVAAPTEAAREWRLASDMQTSPSQENPNRDSYGNASVWHFLASADLNRDPGTYALLSEFTANFCGSVGLQVWHGPGDPCGLDETSCWPLVGINATGVVQQPLTISWPAGVAYAHPCPNRLALVAWRSPADYRVTISGWVKDIDGVCGDGIKWYIDMGSRNLASGSFNNEEQQTFAAGLGGSSLSQVQVSSGDFVYFAIHAKDNYFCDSTAIEITITEIR
jgi:hypothetical protein